MDSYGGGDGYAAYDSSYQAPGNYGAGYGADSSGYYGGNDTNGGGGGNDRRYAQQDYGRYDDAQSDPRSHDRSHSERSGGNYGTSRGEFDGRSSYSSRDGRGDRQDSRDYDRNSSSGGYGGSDEGSRGLDMRGGGGPGGPASPTMGRGAGRGNYQFSEGDWPCPNPGMECNRCGTARPAECIPAGRGRGQRQRDPEKPRSEVPQKGPPFRREGDWACPMCMNVNWGSRSQCNLCQTKNPKLTEEKREGRAGGHFERQEIATKQRKGDDSDEEFDEFGRKKKKRRG